MIARIVSGKSIKGVLKYNEQKVEGGQATCILANRFKADLLRLNFNDKLKGFKDLNIRNRVAKTNTLHISLNFHISEKLAIEDLQAIATSYMERIGFGEQPYLVYQHFDAAHPHVHIVTTLIKRDGKRIPTSYIGKHISEPASRAVEKEFGLVVSTGRNDNNIVSVHPMQIQKAVYGKCETRQTIARIVASVTQSYKYTSLPEFDAILRQFNVTAVSGSRKSKMFERKGLVYSIIDDRGHRCGVPIKASSLPGKPTIPWLESQFKLNEILKASQKDKLRCVIKKVLAEPNITTRQMFERALEKKEIHASFRPSTESHACSLLFVDNNSKTVFTGGDLGDAYSGNAVLSRLSEKSGGVSETMSDDRSTARISKKRSPHEGISKVDKQESEKTPAIASPLMQELLYSAEDNGPNPGAALGLTKKKRRKRAKRL